MKTKSILALILAAASAFAQHTDNGGARDIATAAVVRNRHLGDGNALEHPYKLVARHPKAGCLVTAECGDIFYEYEGHNLRVSAGTTWQSQLMGSVSTPTNNVQGNYLGLTNTAVTPAMADTTLSGLITSNGLTCLQATYTDSSGVISVPAAGTASVVGTTGSTTYNYWIAAQGQGIYTTVSATSNQLTTANATLSTTNYDQVTWTPVTGASSYALLRTTSGTAPTGTQSILTSAVISCTSALCTAYDQSNTLSSWTTPASNLTNYGHYTLVKTWTATASQSAQAFGVFGNSACTSLMFFEGTFTPVALNSSDTFTLTETVNFAMYSLEYLALTSLVGMLYLAYRRLFRKRVPRSKVLSR